VFSPDDQHLVYRWLVRLTLRWNRKVSNDGVTRIWSRPIQKNSVLA